ncbi:hypothetical protein GCM10010199_37810 [Dactylosporangium roseum]
MLVRHVVLIMCGVDWVLSISRRIRVDFRHLPARGGPGPAAAPRAGAPARSVAVPLGLMIMGKFRLPRASVSPAPFAGSLRVDLAVVVPRHSLNARLVRHHNCKIDAQVVRRTVEEEARIAAGGAGASSMAVVAGPVGGRGRVPARWRFRVRAG